MEQINNAKATVAAICGALTALWGWFGWLVVAWVVCMAIDFATGTMAACRAGTWSSQQARDGIWHKAGCVAAVTISGILDLVVRQIIANLPGDVLHFDYTVFLCPLVVAWYILTEAGSIVENADKLGAPIPAWLRKAIAGLMEQVEEER